MASVKVLLIQCTLLLLISVEIKSEEIQRDKRDLKFIKNFLSSTLFGHEPGTTEVNDKEIQNNIKVPKGYKVIYVKRVPGVTASHENSAINSKINIIKSFLGTKTQQETEKVMESANDLIQSGILSEEEVVPLRVGSSQSQFKEIFTPEQHGFFSSELHAPSHFAPKPFVNSLSSVNVETPFVIQSSTPPRSSFGELLNSSFAVSALPKSSFHHFKPIVTAPIVRSRYSYKQSYQDGSNIVYDGSIRTGDRIPQQITNDIKYIMPPPFFVNRIQNIAVVPTISEPVKPAFSYRVIHNQGSIIPVHKSSLNIPINSFSQPLPSLQTPTSTESENNRNIVPVHPYSYVLSNAIPFQNHIWQSPIMPHSYRYIQTYSPPKSPPIAVNFKPDTTYTKINNDYSKITSTITPHTSVETDNLNIHNNNIHIAENNLHDINSLSKSYIKYFQPKTIKVPHLSFQNLPSEEKLNNNISSTNHYTFTQKDSSGNNIIYKNDQVIVENNANVFTNNIKSVSLNDKQELPLATPNNPTYITEVDNISLPKNTNNIPFSPVTDSDTKTILPISTTVQKIDDYHESPKEDIGTFTSNDNLDKTDDTTIKTKRRKIFRRVKVKQNTIKNFKTAYEAPITNSAKNQDESLNNNPIVVLSQPEGSFSYTQINGDGSTRTIHDNENNGVVVDVKNNTESFSNRGDIPV